MNKMILKHFLLFSFLFILLFTLTGCSVPDIMKREENSTTSTSSEDENSNLEGLPVYTAEEDANFLKHTESNGITFSYPSTWISVGTSTQPMYMNNDGSGTSVNLVSEAKPAMFSYSGYVDASIVNLKKQLNLSGDVQKEEINLNGKKAYKLSYTFSQTENDTTIDMSLIQVVLLKDDTFYILSVGSLKDNFEKDKATLEKIIKSFNY